MDKKQAQWILSLARPNGQDQEDPQIVEALSVIATDPDLVRWWESHQTADRHIGTVFRQVSVPAHLRQSILAGARLQPRGREIWSMVHHFVPLALAASLLVAAFLAKQPIPTIPLSNGLATNAAFQNVALATFDHDFDFDHESKDPTQVEAWLASHGVSSLGNVPARLRQKPTIGCRIISWHQRKLVLVCYDLPHDREAHLFVVEGALPDAPGTRPRFETKQGWNTAAWSDEARTYFLTSDAPVEELKTYF